jgi:hypothetical protein
VRRMAADPDSVGVVPADGATADRENGGDVQGWGGRHRRRCAKGKEEAFRGGDGGEMEAAPSSIA